MIRGSLGDIWRRKILLLNGDIMADQNVQRLRRLDCCAVSDALDKLKLTGVVSGLP